MNFLAISFSVEVFLHFHVVRHVYQLDGQKQYW